MKSGFLFIIKRNGTIDSFEINRVVAAITAAVIASSEDVSSEKIESIADEVLLTYKNLNKTADVETMQDIIVNTLIKNGYFAVAKCYLNYSLQRKEKRNKKYDLEIKIDFGNDVIRPFRLTWIFAKTYDLIKEHYGIPLDKHIEHIEKVTDMVVSAVYNENDNVVAVDKITEVLKAALLINKFNKIWDALSNNKSLIWDLDIVPSKASMKLIESDARIFQTLEFSTNNSNSILKIKYFDFVKSFDSLAKKCNSNVEYIKDRVMSLYVPKMHILVFYSNLISFLKSYIENNPEISFEISRMLLDCIYSVVSEKGIMNKKIPHGTFEKCIKNGVEQGIYDKRLLDFDIKKLEQVIKNNLDEKFKYISLQILLDRYLMKNLLGDIIETPQFMFMRVAMGVSLFEENKDEHAIKVYDLLSNHLYICASPVFFNAGTNTPQLSSCYLSTVADSLSGIFQSYSDNAQKSKWSGGIGTDWTNVRARGSTIKGTRGKSNGIIPFLKVYNDICIAVNQGGKRLGTGAAYLEIWHKDIEQFIDLRKNTGEERLRAHDLSLAVWIPDLFMKRAENNEEWTLFCPSEAVGLHETFGDEFESLYAKYEEMASNGIITCCKINALQLYRRILSSLFETGYPWLTFKDAANIRYMQKHAGVIKSSNLCTEIFEHTVANDVDQDPSVPEIAVCNLGSVNLCEHILGNDFDWKKLEYTVHSAIRLMDNIIDINFYPVKATETSNKRHRFLGLGQCGWHDCLIKMGIPFDSDEMIELSDKVTEFITYHAILASHELSKEKGSYPTFNGSEWSKGKVPIDLYRELAEQRKEYFEANYNQSMDWDCLRNKVKKGMRNALTCSIAPTVTVSAILGVSDSISPMYGTIYSKSNLSGSFIYISDAVYNVLKQNNLWSDTLVEDLKYYDGAISKIPYINEDIKKLLLSAFEIPVERVILAGARRQKWLDQGQSLNTFFPHKDGKKIQAAFSLAWRLGLKSMYYLKSKSATTIEKGTVDINAKGIRPEWSKLTSVASNFSLKRSNLLQDQNDVCIVNNTLCVLEEGCTSCQ